MGNIQGWRGITKPFSKAWEIKEAQIIIIKGLKWVAYYLESLRKLLIYK